MMIPARLLDEGCIARRLLIVHATADLHGHLPRIPPGDLLLIGGDIVPLDAHAPEDAARWLDGEFRHWLDALPVSEIVAVWGNHDFIGEQPHLVPGGLRWRILQDSEATISKEATGEALRAYGAPWQPPFMDWAFNLPEPELEKKWRGIPDGLDILLVHGPPHQLLDRIPEQYIHLQNPPRRNVGSTSLRARIEVVRPKVTFCGHIHDSYGAAELDGMKVYNVSHVDERYQPVNPIVTLEL